jgi:flavin-dependent dehydrogenase
MHDQTGIAKKIDRQRIKESEREKERERERCLNKRERKVITRRRFCKWRETIFLT